MINEADIKLRCLRESDEQAYEMFIREFKDSGEKVIPSAADLENFTFSEWLERTEKNARGVDLLPERVPSTIHYLFDVKRNKILGAIDIRHQLNEYLLKTGGNIGYGIVPSERRKGYANAMLSLALEKCKEIGIKKVLITCDKSNVGSAKTIIRNGGILENEICDEKGTIKQRYWIDLSSNYK